MSNYYKILGLFFWGFIESKDIMVKKWDLVSLIKNLGVFMTIFLDFGGIDVLFLKIKGFNNKFSY